MVCFGVPLVFKFYLYAGPGAILALSLTSKKGNTLKTLGKAAEKSKFCMDVSSACRKILKKYPCFPIGVGL